MKKRLLALLAKKEARKQELVTKSGTTEDIEELRSINTEMESLNTEITELRSMIDAIPDEPQNAPPADPEHRGQANPPAAPPQGNFNPIGTYDVGQSQQQQRSQQPTDPYGTLEYRMAFMEFARTGRVTEALRSAGQPEFRAEDTMTQTGDVSAVIPTTILNEIIKKVEARGQIYARIRKASIKGGVTVPILSLKPVATWIGETTPSNKQKVQANSKVTFSYYGLECKVSTSLLADTVTLSGFENVITDLIVEAMLIAIEQAVISGDGDNKFLGITADSRVPNAQKVTLGAAEFGDWSAWKKKVFAKMPLAYKAGATFLMASGTFEGYVDGMVDANGQPIGRINYGITNGPQERFGGKEVILVEDDIIANYDDASVGDVVAIYCNLGNYMMNSNLQMVMFRYFDHDTNEWVDKAILIADGKLLDPNGVVIVKKGS
jgi:HK97 family phage major capsid protein